MHCSFASVSNLVSPYMAIRLAKPLPNTTDVNSCFVSSAVLNATHITHEPFYHIMRYILLIYPLER